MKHVMKYIIYLLPILGLTVFSQVSCKKDCEDSTNPECSSYDPCYGQTSLTAGFEVEELVLGFSNSTFFLNDIGVVGIPAKDTICDAGGLRLTATDTASLYEWHFQPGAGVAYGKSIELFFGGSFALAPPRPLSIELRVYRDIPLSCFPNDTVAFKQIDLTLVSGNESGLIGSYKGYSTQWPDSLLEVNVVAQTQANDVDVFVDGIVPECAAYNISLDRHQYQLISTGFTRGYTASVQPSPSISPCSLMQAKLSLSDNMETLFIEYFIDYKSGVPLEDGGYFLFVGDRI